MSLARNVFLAYHWLRPLLAEGERCFVRSMLIRVAQQMRLRLEQDSFIQMPGHSHTSCLPAYLGIAALVLHKEHDDAQCRKWLQYALDIHQGVLPFHGNADGSWAEGAFYSSSYTKWLHPFFLAVERLSGFLFYHHPFYLNYLAYYRGFVANDNDLHPFGDSFWCHLDGNEWPGFFAQNPLRIYAQRFGSMDDVQKSRQREDHCICRVSFPRVIRCASRRNVSRSNGSTTIRLTESRVISSTLMLGMSWIALMP